MVLIGIGLVTVIQALRQPAGPGPAEPGPGAFAPGPSHHTDSLGRLIISAFALSLDNLAAGFADLALIFGVRERGNTPQRPAA